MNIMPTILSIKQKKWMAILLCFMHLGKYFNSLELFFLQTQESRYILVRYLSRDYIINFQVPTLYRILSDMGRIG